MGCVYFAENKLNGKMYIGQTSCSLKDRRDGHLTLSRSKSVGSDRVFMRALRKYGIEAFVWGVFYVSENEDDLISVEVEMIALFNSKVPNGYNMTDGGDGVVGCPRSDVWRKRISDAMKGKRHTEESKQKMSKALKGRRLSSETRARMSAARKGKPTAPLSVEAREKLRRANLGRKLSGEHKEKIGRALLGRKMSHEAVAKTRAALMGHVVSAETRAKLSAAFSGRKRGPMPQATKDKLSAVRKGKPGRPLSAEHRAKIGAAQRGKKKGPMSAQGRLNLIIAHRNNRPSEANKKAVAEATRRRYALFRLHRQMTAGGVDVTADEVVSAYLNGGGLGEEGVLLRYAANIVRKRRYE